jgi:H+/Cl- antiporter ClcA
LSEASSGSAYLRLVALGALIGVPAALVAALFLAAVHGLEDWLWSDPHWYLVLGLPVLGACVVLAARTLLPGDGGHEPLLGIGASRRRWRTRRAWRWRRSARSPSEPCSGPRVR